MYLICLDILALKKDLRGFPVTFTFCWRSQYNLNLVEKISSRDESEAVHLKQSVIYNILSMTFMLEFFNWECVVTYG